MKLRNKKTGDILPLEMTINGKEYLSLAEFNEDFEDYTPVEPLIKDEKIISLLRPWIKFNKIEKAIIFKIVSETRGLEDSWFHIKGQDCNSCWWDIEINASYSESVDKDYHGELVDIEELCGEEE
jgi:hypothetical protein